MRRRLGQPSRDRTRASFESAKEAWISNKWNHRTLVVLGMPVQFAVQTRPAEPDASMQTSTQLPIEWKVLNDGRLQITIGRSTSSAPVPNQIAPDGTRVLYVSDLQHILRKGARSIYKLGNRKRNPLPFVRGRGRPFILEAVLYRWLEGDPPRRAHWI